MLHRIIYTSEAVGVTATSTLAIAQILGISERNNRRDHLTGCLMFHEGYILQVVEGARADLDRLMRRVQADPRHSDVKILSDLPIAARRSHEPMEICGDSSRLLQQVGLPCLSRLTGREVDAMLEVRRAA